MLKLPVYCLCTRFYSILTMTLQDFDIEESSSIDHQLICHSVIVKVKYSHRLMHLQAKHKASLTKHLERQRICGFHTNTNTQIQKYTITRQRVYLPKTFGETKDLWISCGSLIFPPFHLPISIMGQMLKYDYLPWPQNQKK